uniref:Os05g0506000 protein n=1 Tax=Macrostomum lignano TaxID=282301 RepID=A0A1I8FNV8_9PLAT
VLRRLGRSGRHLERLAGTRPAGLADPGQRRSSVERLVCCSTSLAASAAGIGGTGAVPQAALCRLVRRSPQLTTGNCRSCVQAPVSDGGYGDSQQFYPRSACICAPAASCLFWPSAATRLTVSRRQQQQQQDLQAGEATETKPPKLISPEDFVRFFS